MSYRCRSCDEIHEGIPDVGWEKPDPLFSIPEEERDSRVRLTEDTCAIDDAEFFIRGVIEIPINGQRETLGLGVWVSQKRENFFEYVDNSQSDSIGPFFGWLSTRIPYYQEETFCLKTMAHFRGEKLRPSIELEPTDHPLAVDQRDGITVEKAWDIVHSLIGK